MNTPGNLRRKPPEWDELAGEVGQLMQDGQIDTKLLPVAFDVVSNLSDETLDANRYYSLGQICCTTARLLQDYEIREQVVDVSAASLAIRFGDTRTYPDFLKDKLAAEYPRDSFVLDDLNPAYLNAGFGEVIESAADKLDPAEHFTADLLDASASVRRSGQETTWHELAKPYKSRVMNGSGASHTVSRDVLSGTLATIRGVYRTIHPNRYKTHPRISPEDIRGLDIKAAGAELASMHIDQLVEIVSVNGTVEGLEMSKDGQVRLDPELLKAEVEENKDRIFRGPALHTSKLRCPALHVPGMIPLVAGIVPDILEAAQRKANIK